MDEPAPDARGEREMIQPMGKAIRHFSVLALVAGVALPAAAPAGTDAMLAARLATG
ncbi:MAG: hypothetical protein ACK4IS_05895 [Erythrobacter sp.]